VPRLLVCRECRTIEEIPLYDGPAQLEAQDPLLDNLVRRHVQSHGDISPDSAALLVADESPCKCVKCRGTCTFWEGHRDEILGNLKERWTGFHPEFYHSVSTFKEDAMRCYNLHRRPQGTDCIDFQSDRKRLTPDHWDPKKHVYLCHFCPVASSVVFAKRLARGMYDRQPGETD
jgi:hypothetical protein